MPVLRLKLTVASFTGLMQSKATTVAQYLAELPADRRSVIASVRAVIRQNLDPVFEEGMQYGMIGYSVPHRVYPAGYHCDPRQPLPFVSLASQKNYMSVYLGCVHGPEHEKPFREAWVKTGKKLNMGKSCLRFKKLDDLALDVIGDSIRRTSARGFIEYYESAIKNLRRGLVTRTTVQTSTAKLKRRTSRLSGNMRKQDAASRQKTGVFKEHFADGTLSCVGKYRDGEKVGVWKHYLRNGQLRAVGKFVHGKLAGDWKWYRESGMLMQTGSFVEEKKSGVWKRYHPNGALYDQSKFADNQKIGEWHVYDTKGKLIKTTKHKSK